MRAIAWAGADGALPAPNPFMSPCAMQAGETSKKSNHASGGRGIRCDIRRTRVTDRARETRGILCGDDGNLKSGMAGGWKDVQCCTWRGLSLSDK